MLSPEDYLEAHSDDSLQDLIEEREKLVEEIEDLEQMVFDPSGRINETINITPGIRYCCFLTYLSGIVGLMAEKYAQSQGLVEDDEA